MKIYSNVAALYTLNVMNANTKQSNKAAKQISTGEKFSGASGSASGYNISEKMRNAIRSLEQNDQNVRSGLALVQTAEGGVQGQIELMKRAKELVIAANNTYLTEKDLTALQEELDQVYTEIEDLAIMTDYNEKDVLYGTHIERTVVEWVKTGEIHEIEGTNLEIVGGSVKFQDYTPLKFDFTGQTAASLKGTTFKVIDENGREREYMFCDSDMGSPPSPLLSISIPTYRNGEIDFYSLAYRLNYTLGDSSKSLDSKYITPPTISIPSYATGFEQTVSTDGSSVIDCKFNGVDPVNTLLDGGKIAGTEATAIWDFPLLPIEDYEGRGFSITVYGKDNSNVSYSFTLMDSAKNINYYSTGYGIDINGCTTPEMIRDKVCATIKAVFGENLECEIENGKIKITSKGVGALANTDKNSYVGIDGFSSKGISAYDEAPAVGFVPNYGSAYGTNPYIPIDKDDVNPASDGTKAFLSCNYVEPVQGSGFRLNNCNIVFSTKAETGAQYFINPADFKDGYTGTFAGVKISVADGKVNFEQTHAGSAYGIYYSDGYPGREKTEDVTSMVSQKIPFAGAIDQSEKASATLDIGYSTVEELRKALSGSALHFYDKTYSSVNYYFIDSEDGKNYEVPAGAVKIDLKNLDYAKSPVEALVKILNAANPNEPFSVTQDGKLKAECRQSGERGNGSSLKSVGTNTEAKITGDLAQHYTIDFAQWMDSKQDEIAEAGSLEEFLLGGGFRIDCASCADQWFNFEFINDDTARRPDTEDTVKNCPIDVTGVQTMEDLVKCINDQASKYLETQDHFMFVKMEVDDQGDPTGKLIFYDHRLYDLSTRDLPAGKDGLAVISDGIRSDWELDERPIMVNLLPIQHTPDAYMRVIVKLPRTSLDQVFGYGKKWRSIADYNLLTQESRDNLLGQPPKKGALDSALNYLLSAQTLLGAQSKRLDFAYENIRMTHENLTASESTIRDADIAQAITDKTKLDLLVQTSQATLAKQQELVKSVLTFLE